MFTKFENKKIGEIHRRKKKIDWDAVLGAIVIGIIVIAVIA